MKKNKNKFSDNKEIYKFIYEYKTKYKQGFLPEELKDVLSNFPNINMDKYNDAMMGNTCMMQEEKLVMYHCDVYNAIICGIENRDLKVGEWD